MGIKKIPFFDFSAVLDKLQAIADNVHPTASGTSITPTGMHIVTEDDVQGAISELDSAVDSVYSSLTKFIDFATTSSVSTSVTSGSNVSIDHTIPAKDGYTPVCVVGYELSGTGAGSCTVYNIWLLTGGARLRVHNHGTGTVTLSTVCRIMYIRTAYA